MSQTEDELGQQSDVQDKLAERTVWSADGDPLARVENVDVVDGELAVTVRYEPDDITDTRTIDLPPDPIDPPRDSVYRRFLVDNGVHPSNPEALEGEMVKVKAYNLSVKLAVPTAARVATNRLRDDDIGWLAWCREIDPVLFQAVRFVLSAAACVAVTASLASKASLSVVQLFVSVLPISVGLFMLTLLAYGAIRDV